MRVSKPRLSETRLGQGFQSSRTSDIFPLPTARTYEAGFPLEAGIPGFQDSVVPVIRGIGADKVYSSIP